MQHFFQTRFGMYLWSLNWSHTLLPRAGALFICLFCFHSFVSNVLIKRSRPCSLLPGYRGLYYITTAIPYRFCKVSVMCVVALGICKCLCLYQICKLDGRTDLLHDGQGTTGNRGQTVHENPHNSDFHCLEVQCSDFDIKVSTLRGVKPFGPC